MSEIVAPPTPAAVKSTTAENESIQPTNIPSATSDAAPPEIAPATTAVRRGSAAGSVVSGSSRAAKSKKKKGGNVGGASGSGENTGRWTAEEHRLFLQGLEQHGKGWKKIASLIKSRTVVQIRTHAQKYFQKLAKARQNGEEGEVSMEGRGGITTLTSATGTGVGHTSKRRRQQTGSKRKAIHSVVASAQREGKRIATEEGKSGVPNPVAPLPAVSPVLANFVLPEAADSSSNNAKKSTLASSTTTSQGTISGPALEDSIFRFLTPTPVTASAEPPVVNGVARQAGANPITLPTDHPSSAPTVGGDVSPTGVADLNLYPSWTDGKDPPSWYTKGQDVEALLDVADSLDWLQDSGDPNETYQPAASAGASDNPPAETPNPVDNEIVLDTAGAESGSEPKETEHISTVEGHELIAEDSNDGVEPLPSIFDGAPDESNEQLQKDHEHDAPADDTVDFGESASHAAIEEPLFDNPNEEHDFVSTILEHEGASSVDLPALAS